MKMTTTWTYEQIAVVITNNTNHITILLVVSITARQHIWLFVGIILQLIFISIVSFTSIIFTTITASVLPSKTSPFYPSWCLTERMIGHQPVNSSGPKHHPLNSSKASLVSCRHFFLLALASPNQILGSHSSGFFFKASRQLSFSISPQLTFSPDNLAAQPPALCFQQS